MDASYPERVRGPAAGDYGQPLPMLIAFSESARRLSTPTQLERAATITTLPPNAACRGPYGRSFTYLSDASMHQKFGRRLQERSIWLRLYHGFCVEATLRYTAAVSPSGSTPILLYGLSMIT